jgi:hypothetical protein
MLSIGAILVVALIGVGLWVLGHRSTTAHGTGGPTHSSSSSPSSAATVLTPVSAHGFDAYSSPAQDSTDENDNEAKFAVDSSPSTFWHTQFYDGSPLFGGTKPGTGLILDMGRRVQLSSVKVVFGSVPGANVQIKLGDNNTRAPSTLSTFTTVASGTNLAGAHTFTVTSHAKGRYVLIWFTSLPPKAGVPNQFEAQVYNIVVRGSS